MCGPADVQLRGHIPDELVCLSGGDLPLGADWDRFTVSETVGPRRAGVKRTQQDEPGLTGPRRPLPGGGPEERGRGMTAIV